MTDNYPAPGLYDFDDAAPTFVEENHEVARLATYVLQIPIDLKNSGHVTLVLEPDGDVTRELDGVVIGSWV